MNKNILVISTSPRKGGNSETLADAFIRGAEEAGHRTEKICLYDKTIGFCRGCLACLRSHRSVIPTINFGMFISLQRRQIQKKAPWMGQ